MFMIFLFGRKENVELPHVEGDQTVMPPPFIVRTLLVYGRSYCQIDFKGKEVFIYKP